ncbi:uncharacterized protein LOC122049639 [Zingiber officinale]|uniref:Histone H4 n=1 Tax=Zingiber officinale TaxID=94328 RepID=A0A8J5HJZ1_ZINOF|nr:uncharacterized protein LOC122049639 [Zingiber officinale]KAG6526481.1 hypothetical protein ZIOFF_016466 [Zingiber officinale]
MDCRICILEGKSRFRTKFLRSHSLQKSIDRTLDSAVMSGRRMGNLIYEVTRGVLKIFLKNAILDAVTYTAMDVVYALKRQGRTLWLRCLIRHKIGKRRTTAAMAAKVSAH